MLAPDGRMPRVERRTFLALGVTVLGLAGCTQEPPSDVEGGSLPPRPPAQDPGAGLRGAVAASEVALIAEYRAALAAHPDLAPELGPLVAHHEAHLARVAPDPANPSGVPASPGSSPGSSAAPGAPTIPSASDAADPSSSDPAAEASTDPGAEPDSTAEPDSRAETLGGLAAAEAAAHRDRVAACDAAEDSGLARDLCLIAASEAQHEVVVAALLEERGAR
jgi:hypothetical protein